MNAGPPPEPPAVPAITASVTRGARRFLAAEGFATVCEVSLANGRRADIVGLAENGDIVIVEVKSSVADFRADGKWEEYREFCDALYFALPPQFPRGLIAKSCGLIVGDAYEATKLREAEMHPLTAPRRKAMILRIGLVAGRRLHRLEDPTFGLG
jgi:hypothetical protein